MYAFQGVRKFVEDMGDKMDYIVAIDVNGTAREGRFKVR